MKTEKLIMQINKRIPVSLASKVSIDDQQFRIIEAEVAVGFTKLSCVQSGVKSQMNTDNLATQTPEEKEAFDSLNGIPREHLMAMIKKQSDTIKELSGKLSDTPHQYEMGKFRSNPPKKVRFDELDRLDAWLESDNPEWNGEGLPPVGVECEFVCHDANMAPHNEHHGEIMDCVAHTGLSNGLAVLVSKDLSFATVCNDAWLKKPENPEAKEKREKLEAAYDLFVEWQLDGDAPLDRIRSFESFSKDEATVRDWLRVVDKTGYRKQDK